MILINEILNFISKIEYNIGITYVTDLKGNEFTLKINQTTYKKSIGYLFGFMQKLITQFPIKEYSAQQISLE